MTEQDLINAMRDHGIVFPTRTLKAARAADLGLAIACAILDQESDGGYNVFGHDPTIYQGAGWVTRDKYLAYKRERDRLSYRRMQGVGPTQLTWWEFQDRADALGGCWRPYINMLVGFRLVKAYVRAYGERVAFARYNGSGPYDPYAESVLARVKTWRSRLDA